MRQLDIRITDERTVYAKRLGGIVDEVEVTAYTCPLCHRRIEVMLLDGNVLRGGRAAVGTEHGWIEHCGSLACTHKAERMSKGWRLRITKAIESFRWWLADRLYYVATRLRRQKWYVGEGWHAIPGNRAADLQHLIWVEIVGYTIGKDEDTEMVEKWLGELAELARAAQGHYPPDWYEKSQQPVAKEQSLNL